MAEEVHSEDDDYEEAARSTADYADYQPPQKQPKSNKSWKKLIWSLAAIIIIAALGVAGYWYYKHHKSTKKPAQSTSTSQTTPTSSTHISTATKHYDSTNFNLGFDYPADWTVTDSGNGQLTVKSTAVNLKDASGQQTSAQIIMTIRRSDQKLTEFDSGNAIAALDSEKVAYTKPSQTQRANTYTSFLSYAGSTSGLDGIYVTGNNGYKKAQAIPKADIQQVDPIINVSFTKSDGSTKLTISTTNWGNQDFSDPVKAMLESLSIT